MCPPWRTLAVQRVPQPSSVYNVRGWPSSGRTMWNRPPGRNTRATSARTFSGESTCSSTSKIQTKSSSPSPIGRPSAVASLNTPPPGSAVAKAVKRERPDLQVFGCDLSRSALEAATAEPGGVVFKLATAEGLPFGDGELDFVWIFDVLEHVDSPEKVLTEVARVLRPGGRFHIVLPLEGQPRTLYTLLGCGTRWTAKVRHRFEPRGGKD